MIFKYKPKWNDIVRIRQLKQLFVYRINTKYYKLIQDAVQENVCSAGKEFDSRQSEIYAKGNNAAAAAHHQPAVDFIIHNFTAAGNR